MTLAERMMLAHNAMRGWHRDAWSYRAPIGLGTLGMLVGGIVPLGLMWWANKLKGGNRG